MPSSVPYVFSTASGVKQYVSQCHIHVIPWHPDEDQYMLGDIKIDMLESSEYLRDCTTRCYYCTGNKRRRQRKPCAKSSVPLPLGSQWKACWESLM
jgi:hypothetical protein